MLLVLCHSGYDASCFQDLPSHPHVQDGPNDKLKLKAEEDAHQLLQDVLQEKCMYHSYPHPQHTHCNIRCSSKSQMLTTILIISTDKNICVVVGAGISIAAGMPDFR